MASAFYVAYSDYKHIVEDTVAEGEKVVVRFTFRGVHTGTTDVLATNKSILVGGIAIFRAVDGKVVELHAQVEPVNLT
jgi:predicted ester cyclase